MNRESQKWQEKQDRDIQKYGSILSFSDLI